MPEQPPIEVDPPSRRAGNPFYVVFILLAAVCAYGYSLRKDGIFSCPGRGYGPDSYLAYCGAPQYGDFDHGALWYGLQPDIQRFLTAADVLFLGNSRMQFGFSSDTTDRWFAALPATYYLMGFAYWENYSFEWPLMKRLKLHPKVYIVNLDLFFESTKTGPAEIVMGGGDVYAHYQGKRLWQIPHQLACSRSATVCGNSEAFFRSIQTGGYRREGGDSGRFPASFDDGVDQALLSDYLKRGREFFSSISIDHRCVILTVVPSLGTKSGTMKALADGLGFTFVAPQISGLTMFDHAHLDRPSAERWSRAFFEAAGPRIRQCLGRAPAAGS
jgi:hypothetical protein